MEKIDKALRKLSRAERLKVTDTLRALYCGQTKGLDIKLLKGTANTFRVRIGNLRIIFVSDMGEMIVTHIARRSEKTYRDI